MDHANLAQALLREGKDDDARAVCDLALAQQPESSELYRVRALIFASRRDMDAALADARRAVELAPGDPNALTALGNVLAWNGDLEGALPYVAVNWLAEERSCNERFSGIPRWTGGDVRGQRMFVAHEQGYGDAIQMARYLPFLQARGAHVTVEAAPAAMALLRSAEGVDEVVALDTAASVPSCDTYVRMMTLPALLGIAPEGVTVPYLRVESNRVERRAFQRDGSKPVVGLAWAGNACHPLDGERSMTLADVEPLRAFGDVTWVSLMQDNGFGDLADVAALMTQLDLIVSVDTAVAHLAGALGRPIWTMISRRPDWRWGGSGETTVWYPTMRLFRETSPRWETVIPAVMSALRAG